MKNKNSLLWIWKNSKSKLHLIIFLSISQMILSASYVVPALISKNAINYAVYQGSFVEARNGIIKCGIILLAVIALQLATAMFNTYLCSYIGGKLEMQFKHNFFDNFSKKEYSKLKKFHSGDILNRFTSDIEIVVSGVTCFLPNALSVIAKIVSGFIVIMSFSKGFAGIMFLVGCFVLMCAVMFKPIYKRIHKDVQKSQGVVRSFTQECVENIVVVKSFSNSIPLLKKLDNYMEKVFKSQIKRTHVSNITGGGVSAVFTVGYYGTLLWGAFMMLNRSMDYGTLAAFLQIVSQIQSPFVNASSLISQYYSAQASAERIMEIENLEEDIFDNDFDLDKVYEETESVCADNIEFGYDKENVIEKSSFEIKKGSLVTITGPSGMGKSTLFKLMLGLFSPDCGDIYIKTNSGKIAINSKTRPLFAYVPQGNLLISGTVAENIKFANPSLSDEKMYLAAKTACIYDFISTLPNGFDTVINERGGGLSEGQVQRIAVARALCSDAPILLLDECTSALDTDTEKNMLKNISELKTKTVLFISHKNAALKFSDMHLEIVNGKIIPVEKSV